MSYRLISNGELAQIMANHFRLDFDLVEGFSVVDSNDGPDHLGHNNHVAEMGLDQGWLLVGSSCLFGFTQFLDETHWLALKTALETTTGTSMDQLDKLQARLMIAYLLLILPAQCSCREAGQGPRLYM